MYALLGLPGGTVIKNLPAKVGDSASIPGGGNDNPLQYSCLENPLDRGAWQTIQSTELQRVRHDWAHTEYIALLNDQHDQYN